MSVLQFLQAYFTINVNTTGYKIFISFIFHVQIMISLISNCFITHWDNASWGVLKALVLKIVFPKDRFRKPGIYRFLCLTVPSIKPEAAAVLVPSKRQKLRRGFPLWQAIRGCDIIESTLILLLYFEALWWIKIDEIHAMRQYNYSLIIWLCKTLASQQTIVSHTCIQLWP